MTQASEGGPPRWGSADGPEDVCLTANASNIAPNSVQSQELSNDPLEARGAAAQCWYIGVAIGFKKLAHGEASHSVLERFAAEHRLLIKAAFWRGESRDSVLCRLVDLFLVEEADN
jgi:hypothetical protein